MAIKIHGANGQITVIPSSPAKPTVDANLRKSTASCEAAQRLKEALDRSDTAFRNYYRKLRKQAPLA